MLTREGRRLGCLNATGARVVETRIGRDFGTGSRAGRAAANARTFLREVGSRRTESEMIKPYWQTFSVFASASLAEPCSLPKHSLVKGEIRSQGKASEVALWRLVSNELGEAPEMT